MTIPFIKTPIHCPVCSKKLDSSSVVKCGFCGSELNFDNPGSSPVVKRGSTETGRRVIGVVLSRFIQTNKINLADDSDAMQRILEISERAARDIAENKKTEINIPFITAGQSGPIDLKMKLTADDLS